MEKRIAEIFPTIVVGYSNENYLKHNSKILKLLSNEDYHEVEEPHHPHQTIDRHLEEREEYQDLYNWFRECLDDYKTAFNLDTENLRINLSWANVSDCDTEHHTHVHPNSWISGIYYVTDKPSPTFFLSPIKQKRTGIVVHGKRETRGGLLDADVWRCPGTTGDLVLFPSWLEHYTTPWEPRDDKKRITISFNVMPQGDTSTEDLAYNKY